MAWKNHKVVTSVGNEKYVTYNNNGDRYWGQVDKEGQNHGSGTIVYSDCGSVYAGGWDHGLKSGKGRICFGNQRG